nr:hypothetical protein [Tanacetum cinerariifolium]
MNITVHSCAIACKPTITDLNRLSHQICDYHHNLRFVAVSCPNDSLVFGVCILDYIEILFRDDRELSSLRCRRRFNQGKNKEISRELKEFIEVQSSVPEQ